MNINQPSNRIENSDHFSATFTYSLNVITVPYCLINNMMQSLINSTNNIVNSSISLGQRTVQIVRNPFLLSQIGNLKQISFTDIHSGMRLLQTYLQFRFSKKQHLAGQEIKKKLVDHILEKCSMEWGIEWLKKITTADWNGISDGGEEYVKMADDPYFQEVLALAANPKWGMLVKHAELGFHLVAPLEWQTCMHTISDFINKAVRSRIDDISVTHLINTFISVLLNYRPSDNLEFLLLEFPQLEKILKLMLEKPEKFTLLIPLLLGSKQISSSVSALQLNSFSQYIQENSLKVDSKEKLQQTYLAWLKQKSEIMKPVHQTEKVLSSIKLDRFESGRKKLESVQEELLNKNKMLQIGIVLEYDQDQTTLIWLKRVLTEKLEALENKYGSLTQLEWKIFLVDARTNGNQELIDEINHFLSECSSQYKRITFQHLTGQKVGGKAEAVKLGLTKMCSDRDIVGFVDLSDKINIQEIGHLVASIYNDRKAGNEGVAIGSRRMASSQVENKAFTFLLRSTGLNWIVKAMFPLLSQITDTQTGFKFFSKKAWLNIQKSGLSCKSLAFDIEILQQAARLGLDIKQFPVDFHDNTQDREGEIEGDKITEMVKELLIIRSNLSDNSLNQFERGEGRLLAGGAEHMVFRLEDGSLVKIPHEQFDPHFFGLLKHVVFKNKDKMKWEDQDKN
ncbi:MAG: hypothetical protein H0X29_05535 [Parachlamydiaceae bacterium]|nr:hypothetical protein [Parachlamydiaceae bacterium]